jgi:hypothetical protein
MEENSDITKDRGGRKHLFIKRHQSEILEYLNTNGIPSTLAKYNMSSQTLDALISTTLTKYGMSSLTSDEPKSTTSKKRSYAGPGSEVNFFNDPANVPQNEVILAKLKTMEEWISLAECRFQLLQEQRQEELRLIAQTRLAAECVADRTAEIMANYMSKILRVMLSKVYEDFPDRRQQLRLSQPKLIDIEHQKKLKNVYDTAMAGLLKSGIESHSVEDIKVVQD